MRPWQCSTTKANSCNCSQVEYCWQWIRGQKTFHLYVLAFRRLVCRREVGEARRVLCQLLEAQSAAMLSIQR